jgi:carboxypeptidase Q
MVVGVAIVAAPLGAQAPPAHDAVLQRIWDVGMRQSQAEPIAQALLDSIGPRLTGTPGMERASDWAVQLLTGWGIDARKEQYGTWLGWDRGVTHIDLLEPRVRSLEGMMVAWSGGTPGPVTGPVVALPEYHHAAELDAWLESVRGKFVAISFPQPTCRPDAHYAEYGTAGALARMQSARQQALQNFRLRYPSAGALRARLEQAGALGVIESHWSDEIGVNRIFATNIRQIPTIDLSCEDYGLLWRLAENGQSPVIRLNAEARFLGEVPVHNTIAEIRGRDLPEEYVILSAHFDSWDGASGATDNGTGSTVMLEAMRILREVHPNPRRTILLGLWGGEEQGLNGSRRFAALNPDIVQNLQALFNQDTGTGRVNSISAQGLVGAGAHLSSWLARVPEDISQHIELLTPDLPSPESSDHAAFICAGAPAFYLRSVDWSYGTHTWHTNRDTYDKVVFEEIRNNAVLLAMLAYLAAEDPEHVSRERRVMPLDPQGRQLHWPSCQPGQSAF